MLVVYDTFMKKMFDELLADVYESFGLKPSQVDSVVPIDDQQYRSYETNFVDGGLEVKVALPGTPNKDVGLTVVDGRLVVKIAKDEKVYTQRYTVHSDFDVKKATAKMAHGLLTINVPKFKPPESQEFKIEIQ